jgi:hypothetical protein
MKTNFIFTKGNFAKAKGVAAKKKLLGRSNSPFECHGKWEREDMAAMAKSK